MKPSEQPKGRDESSGSANEGEGNRTAARRYNEATRDFVESGKVEGAAEAAAPQSKQEDAEMRSAEREGRAHAKEEDPSLRRGAEVSRQTGAEAGRSDVDRESSPGSGDMRSNNRP